MAKGIVTQAKWLLEKCPESVRLFARRHYLTRWAGNDGEPEMAVIKKLIRPGMTVLDIGANIGTYTLPFALLVGSVGQVIAFEPLRENLRVLRARVKKLDNVTVHAAAVGATGKVASMAVPPGLDGYYLARLGDERDGERRETVQVMVLDEMYLPKVDFIKCDIEAGELEMLQGSRLLIERCQPNWMMEVSKGTADEVFEFMLSRGYSAFGFNREVDQLDQFVKICRYVDKTFTNFFFLREPPPTIQVS
jgi:FkbM family methyltransferase